MEEKLSTRWRFCIVPNAIFDECNDLSYRAKLVYCCLSHYANRDLESYPGVGTIARACSVSENTCRRGIRELQDAGLLTREPRYDATGARTSDLYTLEPPTPLSESGGVRNLKGGGSHSAGGGGSEFEPEQDPDLELDPANNNHSGRAALTVTRGDDATALAVVVVNRYRDVTGLSDLSLRVVHRWLEEHGMAKILEKIDLMQEGWASVRVPASWLGQALRYDWCRSEDVQTIRLRKAATERNRRTRALIQAAKEAEARAVSEGSIRQHLRQARVSLLGAEAHCDAET